MSLCNARRTSAAVVVLLAAAWAASPRVAPADARPAATSSPVTVPSTAPAASTVPATAAAAPAATEPAATAPAATVPATGTAPTGPPAVKVRRGDLALEVRADGLFQPVDPFEVKPTFKAYVGPLVVATVVGPGAMVRKGQPVVSFDRTWVDWQLVGVEGEAGVARATQAKAEADARLAVGAEQLALRQAEDAVRNVEAGRKWFEDVDGPQLLQLADLNVRQAQNSLDDQTDELDQLKKMYQGEELTAATADIVVRRAVRSAEQAKVALKMQQERRDKTKSFEYPVRRQQSIDVVETAKTALASLKAQQEQTAVARAAGLRAAQVAVEQAAKRLADLKEDAAQFQVLAPADGVAAYGNQVDGTWTGGDPKAFRPGERVAAGQVLMRVYRPGKLRLVLALPEAQAFWVSQGDRARVTPAATPQASYAAAAGAVEVQAKGPQGLAFATTVDLDDADARLVPGMKASVVIEPAKATDVLLVPLAMVTAGKVRVKDKDGATAERAVKLGRTDGQQAEVLGGLGEGDEVVKK